MNGRILSITHEHFSQMNPSFQMQFDTWNREITSSSITAEDSDEEIRNLQARIREKRRQKLSGTAVSASPSVSTLTESTSDPQRWVRSLPLKVESMLCRWS